MVYTQLAHTNFRVTDRTPMPLPDKVLMVEPSHFDVQYVINPHMEGHVGAVDRERARSQWNDLKRLLELLGLEVHVIAGQPGLPDMVFCANQSLPCLRGNGDREVIMSIMHADQRKSEVPFVEAFFRDQGYRVHYLDAGKVSDFEGMGDALWHPERRIIWGGYGFRSSLEAYNQVSELFKAPVIALELVDPAFYHLDTCLCLLDQRSALYYPPAFTADGRALLHAFFKNLVPVTEEDALEGFACNALCPDGKNVIIQKGLVETNQALEKAGFTVHETDTSEYLKSGGSVFCMKMMFW